MGKIRKNKIFGMTEEKFTKAIIFNPLTLFFSCFLYLIAEYPFIMATSLVVAVLLVIIILFKPENKSATKNKYFLNKNSEKHIVDDKSFKRKIYEAKENTRLDYNKTYTYCAVKFGESNCAYYYKTCDPELKVGDLVYVPTGYNNEKGIGKVMAIKNVYGYDAPYPLKKTKNIISKV